MTNQDEIKSCQELYNDIDSCIEALIKARLEHNQEDEGKALFRMEGLMVAALQQLSYFIDKPIPADVQEAAYKAYPVDMLGDVHHPRLLIDRNQTKRESFIEGMLAERERMMKEAVECEIGWSDGYRLAPADENSMNEALAKIGVLDQVGAGVDAKVSVIIIKKEK